MCNNFTFKNYLPSTIELQKLFLENKKTFSSYVHKYTLSRLKIVSEKKIISFDFYLNVKVTATRYKRRNTLYVQLCIIFLGLSAVEGYISGVKEVI